MIGQTIVLACGGAEPSVDESAYLRAGVDPGVEATRLERQYRGFRREVRIDARTFTALSMVDGSRSLVRVVTSRGVALAVDAPEEHGRTRVGLLEGFPADLDGDGQEEVLVFADDPALDRRCIAIVRIEDGVAREVRLSLDELDGDACVEQLADVDDDGRAEALVVVRFTELALGTAPRIVVPFGGTDWARLDRPELRERERAARSRAWETWEEAYRAAVELAALADAEPVGAFDAALEAWAPTPAREAQCERAREVIAGWE